jgi:methyl-accepting chemotaxis protein
MITNKSDERIRLDEYAGEKLISNVRLALGIIYIISVPVLSVIRKLTGDDFFPAHSNIGPCLFLFYSLFMFIYVRKKEILHSSIKYISTTLDALLISTSIWIGCTYPEIAPPVPFISIQAIFYNILILTGAFRYSTKCAYYSGIIAGVCFLSVVIINRNVLDLTYYFEINGNYTKFTIPIYNESFRVIGMILTGLLTGLASKRLLALLNNMVKSEITASEISAKIIEQSRNIAKTIRLSTNEIFQSSSQISTTANNQASSLQEIKTTIEENSLIVSEITEKTESVANLASKMENDVIGGFNLLERNVSQMESIKRENDGVISGIIDLRDKILNIREIIHSINAITDQTKVIAFNAALEAVSTQKQGKRFSLVASEVNRLADDITVLTKQIRIQIQDIQKSSSSLIISSQDSKRKIYEGNNLIKELENIFCEIRTGAETTANQIKAVKTSTQMQYQSTGHINSAITDISAGLNSFLLSTEAASSSAGKLSGIINELSVLLNIEME